MTRNPMEPEIKDLPREIPVFPLNGALLLPGGRLPLNIFEDRYLAMVRDVLTMDFRAFGMIQTTERPEPGGEGADHNPCGKLFDIGCLGRLTGFEETDDGRYLITLEGLVRFKVLREIDGKDGYRRVEACYDGFTGDIRAEDDASIDRERLLAALRPFFGLKGIDADWQMIEECGCDRLVTTLSMICPLSWTDKQALLEASGTGERAGILTSLLEMEAAGGASNDDGGKNVH